MSFIYIKYLPIVLVIVLILAIAMIRVRNKFASLVYDYWFVKLSWWNKLSFLFNFIGITLLLIALLDLRGAEDKISAQIPDQKTVIMIDTSASMLADDVRPSRFKKAILMARHFVKNAAGHQISVVIFSDIQKQIVPFTDDIDLLEARIEGLNSLQIRHGGSNISQALSEVKSYFQTASGRSTGNVLLFTDGEEGNNRFKIDDPGITLAVVGIGTIQGGKIPLRDKYNKFRGYKRYAGKDVITKLNENFFKMLGKSFKNYRYWIAQSYSIPTEEILQFFRTNFVKSSVKGEVIIRPVVGDRLVKVAIAFIILGVLFRFPHSFSFVLFLLVLSFSNSNFAADKQYSQQVGNREDQKLQKELTQKLTPYLKLLKEGKLNRLQRLKMAEFYLKMKEVKKAALIYQESYLKIEHDDPSVIYNQAVANLLQRKINLGVEQLHQLLKHYPHNKKIKEIVSATILQVLLQEAKRNKQQQQQKKKSQQQKKDKQNKKDSQKNDQKQSGKQQKKSEQKKKEGEQNKKDQQKSEQDKQKQQDQKDKQDKKKKQQDKGKSSKDKKEDKLKKKQSTKPQSIEEKEAEIKRKRRMVKVPTILKKILSDDRKLQEQYIDTKTDKRSRKRQDW